MVLPNLTTENESTPLNQLTKFQQVVTQTFSSLNSITSGGYLKTEC